MEAFTFNTTELILLSATGVLLIIQLIYYLGLYNRIHTHNLSVGKDEVHFGRELPPLSVVICARNESENLRRNLPTILKQDYPDFEVIVINDGSTDESEDLLSALEEEYPNLYHSFTPDSARYISRKKLALTLGIKASKHDWLVFTEADCAPVSNQWLRRMARNFTSSTDIVLGYSGYERGKGWLHKRASFDSLFTSLRYLGFALAGKPYMGIGRNLAYRKELFFKVKGFSTHLNMQRGEDDLFINQVANENNTRVETSPDAVIRMQPVERYKDWKEELPGSIKARNAGSWDWKPVRDCCFMPLAWRGLYSVSSASTGWLSGYPCYCGSSAIRYKPTSSTKQPVRWVTTVLTTLRCRFLT